MKTKVALLVTVALFVLTACFGQETFHFGDESEVSSQINYSVNSGESEMSGDVSIQDEILR